jgi:hypothetical protein
MDKNEIYALCKINFFSVSLTVFDIISRKLRCLHIPRVAYFLNNFGLPNIKDYCRKFLIANNKYTKIVPNWTSNPSFT